MRAAAKDEISVDVNRSAATCSEKGVRDVCACIHYKHGISVGGFNIPNGLDMIGLAGSYLCSSCQDKSKWGFGCDMECPSECPFGCDFSGDCVTPPHCTKNWRVGGDKLINKRGECAACDNGFSGKLCEDVCPANCADTAEGKCSRGGMCYRCKTGFFGEDCSQECPVNCPDCVMKDVYAVEDEDDEESEHVLVEEAGSCPNGCQGDSFGMQCDMPCPENCHKFLHSLTSRLGLGVIASCYQASGICKKCTKNQWWGKRCEFKCSSGCAFGKCDRSTGQCLHGCEIGAGKWGATCDEDCPSGCAKGRVVKVFEQVIVKATGLAGRVEEIITKNGAQFFKISGAADGEFKSDEVEPWKAACDQGTGVCRDACKPGFFGSTCAQACPNNTHPDTGCDRETGVPPKCVDGFYPRDGVCASCPDTCAGGTCNQKGHCTDGCEEGFHGKFCELNCPNHCEGPCDAKNTGLTDGRCKSCSNGFTGRYCSQRCDPTCRTCASWAEAGPLATSSNACTSCREHGYESEPVFFKANSVLGLVAIPPRGFGSCTCLEGASRPAGESSCVCDAPEDSDFVERFEISPKRACRWVCKEGLREVLGDKHSICISNQIYKAVLKAEALGWKQGACDSGMYEIPLGSNQTKCMQEDHVKDIIREEGA